MTRMLLCTLLVRSLLNLRHQDKPSLFSCKQIYERIPTTRAVPSQDKPEVNIQPGEGGGHGPLWKQNSLIEALKMSHRTSTKNKKSHDNPLKCSNFTSAYWGYTLLLFVLFAADMMSSPRTASVTSLTSSSSIITRFITKKNHRAAFFKIIPAV